MISPCATYRAALVDNCGSIRAQEENAKSEVNLLDVAFWPKGSALCLFYGPTSISKPNKIEPYSPVNIVGYIMTEQGDIINKVKTTTKIIIKHTT